jgi:hypothetical protein
MARSIVVLVGSLVAIAAGAKQAGACACGCGIFDAGGSSMFPHGEGGLSYLEWDYQNQHENWHRGSRAPGIDNPDKQIETHFITLGLQYMFNPDWGVQIDVPYDVRHFVTTGGATGDDIVSLRYNDLGDIRVRGIFDGFLDDHSLGVTFGFKLPTGNYAYQDAFNDLDRDTELGSGSTDLLLGAFFHRQLWRGWSMFAQALFDLPVLQRDHYYPGLELDASVGTLYTFDVAEGATVAPLLQVIESARTSDGGKAAAHPVASGFHRLVLSPGIEVNAGPVMVYGDVEVPVYIHVTGDQLIAPVLFKAMVGFKF